MYECLSLIPTEVVLAVLLRSFKFLPSLTQEVEWKMDGIYHPGVPGKIDPYMPVRVVPLNKDD